MPQPRPASAEPAALDRFRAWADALRPDLSGPGLRRLAVRAATAGMVVTCMVALADWHRRGFLRPGGLDRLISMKETPAQEARTSTQVRGKLDQGRLKALISASGR